MSLSTWDRKRQLTFTYSQLEVRLIILHAFRLESKLRAVCSLQKSRCELTSLFSCIFLFLNNIIMELSGQTVARWAAYKATVLKTEPPRNNFKQRLRRSEEAQSIHHQKRACTHAIFSYLSRCCHEKKIEYKLCHIKHRWEQALTRTCLPFELLPSLSLGSWTTLCQIEPIFLNNIPPPPHLQRLLERNSWHCKGRLSALAGTDSHKFNEQAEHILQWKLQCKFKSLQCYLWIFFSPSPCTAPCWEYKPQRPLIFSDAWKTPSWNHTDLLYTTEIISVIAEFSPF